jgi:hypothetical protein
MELTEFEEGAINACRRYRMDDDYALEDFIEDLRQIMPPTFTLKDRKFLDEIRGKGEYIDNMGCIIIPKLDVNSNEHTGFLFQSDFETNLSELVEGKQ